MKLYIWHDPYGVAFGMSLLIAVAENLRAAKKEAREKAGRYAFGRYQGEALEWVIIPTLGKPNRVLNLPCAEWHEWSE